MLLLLQDCSIHRVFPSAWKNKRVFPSAWKRANITPIFKGGDRLEPINYRPIFLTSHVVKVMERIIKAEIVEYLDANCLINNIQHGFRSHRSTVTD